MIHIRSARRIDGSGVPVSESNRKLIFIGLLSGLLKPVLGSREVAIGIRFSQGNICRRMTVFSITTVSGASRRSRAEGGFRSGLGPTTGFVFAIGALVPLSEE